MALTLDATLAAETSNSYVTTSYCDDYWATHYSQVKAAQWAALSDTQKPGLLIQACRVLETVRCTYPVENLRLTSHWKLNRTLGNVIEMYDSQVPVRSNARQALQFPRNLDRDTAGVLFVPEAVMMAQCEQAVYLTSVDDSAVSSRLLGVELDTLTAGQIRVSQKFVTGSTLLAPMAVEYLKPFFARVTPKFMRG